MNFTFDARLYDEYRWLNTDGDGRQNLLTAEFRAPFAGGKWQVRAKVRSVNLKADFNDDGFDDVNERGFGDTDIRVMTIPYLNMEKKLAVAVGVEAFIDTASEDALGTGATSLAPFIFLGIFNPIGPGSIFVPGYQHTFSIKEADGRDKVHGGLIDMFARQNMESEQVLGLYRSPDRSRLRGAYRVHASRNPGGNDGRPGRSQHLGHAFLRRGRPSPLRFLAGNRLQDRLVEIGAND